METLTNDECRRKWKLILHSIPIPVHDFETLCAFSGKTGNGICSGDSGGPLVSGNKLIGITSWGFGCGNGVPDGFTRVSQYVDWVNNKIEALL